MTSLQSALAATESRLAERVSEFNKQVAALEAKVVSTEQDREVALSTLEKIHVSCSFYASSYVSFQFPRINLTQRINHFCSGGGT